MCVALPGRVVEILDEEHGLVAAEVAGDVKHVSVAMLLDDGETVAVGDWVELHSGHAFRKLSDDEAEELLRHFEELDAAHRAALEGREVDLPWPDRGGGERGDGSDEAEA